VHVKSPAAGIAVSQDGKYAYVANWCSDNYPGNTISVIDATNNSVIATINVDSRPWGVAISPTGKMA
jgi:YVTN family beta-propeller protein